MATVKERPQVLTPSQERFCKEYVIDFNATKAYQRAYPKATYESALRAGPRLWGNVGVQQRVAELQALTVHEEPISIAWVLKRLREEATYYGDGASHSARVTAATQIGKHLGMFPEGGSDRTQPAVRIDLNHLPNDELRSIYRRLTGRDLGSPRIVDPEQSGPDPDAVGMGQRVPTPLLHQGPGGLSPGTDG